MNEQDPRLGVVGRRVGYAIAGLVNLVLLYVLNIRPGWASVSFLTDDTPQVLVLVNLSLLAGIAANLVYIAADRRWVKAIGDLTTTTISMAVLIRLWQVFPFDFAAWTFDWGLVVRIALALALAGTGVALVVQTLALIRLTIGRFGDVGSGSHALR